MKTVLLINDTSNEAHIGSRSVINVIKKQCEINDMDLLTRLNRNQIAESSDERLIELFSMVDIVLINGEGSLHHHPRSATEFFPRIMNLMPKSPKVVLINALWQSMYYEGIAEHIERLDLISVRESLSYEDFIKDYQHPNLRVTPDLIFANNFDKIDRIGYSDSVKRKIRSTFKKQRNYLPLNYIDSGSYLNPKTLTYPSLEAYILWLRSLDLYVTGRFHGLCLAVLANTPFVAYESNSHKIGGILKDMGCTELLIRERRDEKRKKDRAIELLPNTQGYLIMARGRINQLFKNVAEL